MLLQLNYIINTLLILKKTNENVNADDMTWLNNGVVEKYRLGLVGLRLMVEKDDLCCKNLRTLHLNSSTIDLWPGHSIFYLRDMWFLIRVKCLYYFIFSLPPIFTFCSQSDT